MSDKFFGWAQLILSQIPGVINLLGVKGFSIYQPVIYKDHEGLLILPLFVGCVATWAVMTYKKRAMWGIISVFLTLASVVGYIYFRVDTLSSLHTLNWAMFYCLFALLLAGIYGLIAG